MCCPVDSNAFATTVSSAIVIAKRSWPNAVNFWEWRHSRKRPIHRSRSGTIEIATSNSLVSLCENARLATRVAWLFSNVWQPSLSNQHLSIHHEIITTELEFDSAERLAVQVQDNRCLTTLRTVENQPTPPLLHSHGTENRLNFCPFLLGPRLSKARRF